MEVVSGIVALLGFLFIAYITLKDYREYTKNHDENVKFNLAYREQKKKRKDNDEV